MYMISDLILRWINYTTSSKIMRIRIRDSTDGSSHKIQAKITMKALIIRQLQDSQLQRGGLKSLLYRVALLKRVKSPNIVYRKVSRIIVKHQCQ